MMATSQTADEGTAPCGGMPYIPLSLFSVVKRSSRQKIKGNPTVSVGAALVLIVAVKVGLDSVKLSKSWIDQ